MKDLNHPGAVSPIADPIDPLINVSPGMALSQSTVPVVNVSPSPVSKSLPGRSLKYVVKAGDTLSGIAVQFGARDLIAAEDAIAQASHVANKNLIFVGQVLTIPQPLP
ncbi:LysM peptidoglycan-binding domain-containing protein [Sulfobacillus sp. DSM 109850]|uniref:LysM peptidoglycan-binding domain-containing protein n=2 Tax=Sulfobacillus harzensis TaxID=2729629 RepID=A0A7Y0L020_9FIRM|nr:LysM peptidoglycan-binding domain-containing protein [Sulfobacillus harzensis]